MTKCVEVYIIISGHVATSRCVWGCGYRYAVREDPRTSIIMAGEENYKGDLAEVKAAAEEGRREGICCHSEGGQHGVLQHNQVF